jgi:hypothetical protein
MRSCTPGPAGDEPRPAPGREELGTTPYYAGLGPGRGTLIYNPALLAIRVTETPLARRAIGAALCVGWSDCGAAVWKLTVQEAAVPGRWIVVDREFRRVRAGGTGLRAPRGWLDREFRRAKPGPTRPSRSGACDDSPASRNAGQAVGIGEGQELGEVLGPHYTSVGPVRGAGCHAS